MCVPRTLPVIITPYLTSTIFTTLAPQPSLVILFFVFYPKGLLGTLDIALTFNKQHLTNNHKV